MGAVLAASAALLSPLAASAALLRSGTGQAAPAAQFVVGADLLAGGSEAEMIKVVATGAVLYRFTFEIVAPDGRPYSAAGWEATVFMGGYAMRAVRLSAGQR
jgi:hypothetical protein